jgi:ABC-type sugar transport system ATPase subunit
VVADDVNAVEARGLTKIFAGRKVLDGVDFEVRAGAIHALLGANGSGKSTTVKLLTGVYQPDSGVIAIGGREVRSIAPPRAASSLGVAVVHQEAPFFDALSVAECIAQFRGYPTRRGRI